MRGRHTFHTSDPSAILKTILDLGGYGENYMANDAFMSEQRGIIEDALTVAQDLDVKNENKHNRWLELRRKKANAANSNIT